jgi:hypothetical protein
MNDIVFIANNFDNTDPPLNMEGQYIRPILLTTFFSHL